MCEPARYADVVVVGASVAGLAAARQLTGAGLSVLVLEKEPQVGGRMSTEKIDGFRLDRIGRPLMTPYPARTPSPSHATRAPRPVRPGRAPSHHPPAYPEPSPGSGAGPGLEGLGLRPFSPGVTVHSDGRTYRTGTPMGIRRATGALATVRARASAPGRPLTAPLQDALDQAARVAATSTRRLWARPELPTARALTARGLPSRTVGGFLRPLLVTLLCDPELSTSSRYADLALASFVRGRLCLPEGGDDAVPELLAAALPVGTVRTGTTVTAVATTRVTTAEHGEITCRAVLVATGARSAEALLPGLRVPAFHPVTVVHHTADETPFTEPALLIDADHSGPVAHTAVVSQVDPTRAPAGRVLISSTVLGAPRAGLEAAVRAQLARLYGTSTTRWEPLTVRHTPEAVPAMPPPHDPRRPVRLLTGLYVCGDHRDTSTLHGALHSGRRAAGAVLEDFGGSRHEAARQVPTVA